MSKNTLYAYYLATGMQEIISCRDWYICTLRIRTLNISKAVQQCTTTLAHYKKFMVALGENDILQVHSLVSMALCHSLGINAILQLIDCAAVGLYNPKGYDKKTNLWSQLLLLIGGSCVAHIAHCAFGGPSVSTIRQHTVLQPLQASCGYPTDTEIYHNIAASFPDSGSLSYPSNSVCKYGYVLMIDKIKVEERLRWDPSTNKLLGVCREDSTSYSLDFKSMRELEQLLDGLESKDVH